MANLEHLKILKDGVEAWNKWREHHHGIFPDLTDADLKDAVLRGADFRHIDLRRAVLTGAVFRGADLTGANLRDAVLSNAVLTGANLRDAVLTNANLTNSVLTGANLRGAVLRGAILIHAVITDAELSGANLEGVGLAGADLTSTVFRGADLKSAEFAGCVIGFTLFADCDLSKAQGLDKVRHNFPSTIGIDTIYKSNGKIPEVFLRGAGVPENLIEYVHSLTVAAFEYYSCFISYSSKDEDFAKRLYADLQAQKVRCWFAPEDLKIGERFRKRIDEVIRVYDKLLLILSEKSVESDWVEKEVETAMEREREQKKTMLFPVRLDDAALNIKTGWAADIRRTRHIGDFTKWQNHEDYKKAFDRLMRDLKSSESKDETHP